MAHVTVAATQFSCTWDIESNLKKAEQLVRESHQQGAQIILIQELFATPYFCKDQDGKHFDLAETFEDSRILKRFSELAKELQVVLPISYFETSGQAYFNSLAVIDADGTILDNYRKAHIPDGPGYQEKFYFTPGDSGFQVWQTRYAKIGVGICWDQWFPEAARSMVLDGAEILFYPTAIGSEPQNLTLDSKAHWQRVMQGHAAANMVPLVASNRIGKEKGESCELTFYGSSFITDGMGAKVIEANRAEERCVIASFDLTELDRERRSWGVFRDRRPDHYWRLTEQ